MWSGRLAHPSMHTTAPTLPLYTTEKERKVCQRNEPNKATIIPPGVMEMMGQKNKDLCQFVSNLWSSGVIGIAIWRCSVHRLRLYNLLQTTLYKAIQANQAKNKTKIKTITKTNGHGASWVHWLELEAGESLGTICGWQQVWSQSKTRKLFSPAFYFSRLWFPRSWMNCGKTEKKQSQNVRKIKRFATI